MEREPTIAELNELFGADGYEPLDIEWEEVEEENEGWVKINYLLNTKTQFTKENISTKTLLVLVLVIMLIHLKYGILIKLPIVLFKVLSKS